MLLLKLLCSALVKCWIPPSAFPFINLLLCTVRKMVAVIAPPSLESTSLADRLDLVLPRLCTAAVVAEGMMERVCWPPKQLVGQADALGGNFTVCAGTQYTQGLMCLDLLSPSHFSR